jgi:chromosome segregation ATPase
MVDNVKILEDLVDEAVDRLRELSRERNQLREEIDLLRERLDAAKQEISSGDGDSAAEQGWRGRQARALAVVNEALDELHGD